VSLSCQTKRDVSAQTNLVRSAVESATHRVTAHPSGGGSWGSSSVITLKPANGGGRGAWEQKRRAA
jgi:hypothetical protein